MTIINVAYVLIVMTMFNNPSITMQEFSSQESCLAAREWILQTRYPNATFVATCIPK